MTPLRILHLTRDYPPAHSGGLSTAVYGMVRALQKDGCECVVMSFDNFRPAASTQRDQIATVSESSDGTAIIRVHEKVELKSALELVAKLTANVVHVHHEGLWELGHQAAASVGARALFSAHTLQSEQDRLRGSTPSRSSDEQARALTSADLIHAPSHAVADLLCARLPAIAPKIRTIALASDISSDPEGDLRSEGEPPLLLYVGRFADVNGFAQFLAALPPLFERFQNLRAVAAGGLPGNEKGAKRWINRWSKMAGGHEVRLDMPGWLGRDELSVLYRRATLLVVPSWFETFGQVILEGMLHGTPILTTGAGAIAELVDDESALIMEAKSSVAIIEGVVACLDNPEAARARAQLALRRAGEGYLWSDRMPALLGLYRELSES